jgi:16S rRNA G1207 methylase RsmC
MIDMVNWKNVKTVLEPSCGLGNIAFNLPDNNLEIDCIEINKEMADKFNINRPQNTNSYYIMNFSSKYDYDLIIGNPPFSKLQSIKHFNKMVSLLSDNGQLVCILPVGDYDKSSSIKLRQEFTKFVDDNGCEIIYLNEGDFKESGTMVKTMIVKFEKESELK